MKYGKWLAGGLGWVLFGPIGGLVGFLAGTVYDESRAEGLISDSEEDRQETKPGDFAVSLLVLVAATMKADGRVTKSELEYVKSFFVQQFGVDKARESMLMLRDIVNKDIPVDEVCGQIRRHMDYHSRLQLLHTLYGIAYADGQIHPDEIQTIDRMARLMGLQEMDLLTIKAMFGVGSSYQRTGGQSGRSGYQGYGRPQEPPRQLENAYQILGLSSEASDEEIKKQYRQMAVRYHPDKVAHLGEDHQKAATEKFQNIQKAYETIRKARNM